MPYTFTRTGAQIEEIHNTVDNIYNTLGNTNLLSNHNFLIQTPDDSHPLPDATPRSYPPGHQIFSGVFANEASGITNLTYINGRVSFSGGDFYMAVPNTGAISRLTAAQLVASVADFDGKPRTRGVSFALVGDEYRVTVGVDALEDVAANPTPLGSVKFEQGSVATGHEIGSLSARSLSDYTDIIFDTVDNMVSGSPVPASLGNTIRTKSFNTPVICDWFIRTSHSGFSVALDSGLFAELITDDRDIRHYGGKPDDQSFDNTSAKDASWSFNSILKIPETGVYYFDSPLKYPSNGASIIGEGASWFNGSSVAPGSAYDPATNPEFIDLNEKNTGFGGQANKLKNIRVIGGMSDFEDPSDPFVNVTAISSVETKDSTEVSNVWIVDAGIPMNVTGWLHKIKDIYMTRVHVGPNFESTASSVIGPLVLQTASKNWGSWTNISAKEVTYQNGTELPTLTDDRGIEMNGICSITGWSYVEAGNRHYFLQDNAKLYLENPTIGYTQLSGGGSGHHSINCAQECGVKIIGGKLIGTRSYLMFSDSSLDYVSFDFARLQSEQLFINSDSTDFYSNVDIEFGDGTSFKKVDGNVSIDYAPLQLSDGAATRLADLPGNVRSTGTYTVIAEGANTYDYYTVDFSASNETSLLSNINTIFRNTGGSGDNNIALEVSSGGLIATANRAGITIHYRVNGVGIIRYKQQP